MKYSCANQTVSLQLAMNVLQWTVHTSNCCLSVI